MKRQPGGIATGLVVALLGLWLVLRTVTHDDEGKNLPDRILGLDGDGADSSDDDSADTPVDPAAISAATSAVGAAGAKGDFSKSIETFRYCSAASRVRERR